MSYKVGIICAGDSELEPFIPMIKKCVVSEKAMLKFCEGKINSVEIVTLFSGVCKVNAAIAAQILIDTYKVDCIINAGTAGGMDTKLELFDTVVATESAYHDVAADILTDFHPWMDSLYFKSDKHLLDLTKKGILEENIGTPIYWGRIVTGESFIEDHMREEINKKFTPLCVDMETASIAHVCYVNRTPFIAIRSITDTADHRGIDEFDKNCEKASEISMKVVMSLLKVMKEKTIK